MLEDLSRLQSSVEQIESTYGHTLNEMVDTMTELLRAELEYLENPTANREPVINKDAHPTLIHALSGLNREHFNA